MSATLQRDWLRRAPDLGGVDKLPMIPLEPTEKTGPLWTVAKTVRVERLPAAQDDKVERWAGLIADAHDKAGRGVTLAITNTVKSAVALHRVLEKRKTGSSLLADLDLRLVHSRFRGRMHLRPRETNRTRGAPDAERGLDAPGQGRRVACRGPLPKHHARVWFYERDLWDKQALRRRLLALVDHVTSPDFLRHYEEWGREQLGKR